jgi:Adenylate and Guanylate cyclase catalytic domain
MLLADVVNTAARMESTGMRDRIQVSQATADALTEAGKGHWLVKRDTLVVAKGKGEMQTYWINEAVSSRRQSTGENSRCSISSQSTDHTTSAIWGSDDEVPEVASQRSKHQSLIDYNVDLLAMRLKHVVARRKVLAMAGRRCSQGGLPPNMESYRECKIESGGVLDEVTEVIKLPSFNSRAYKGYVDPESIELDPLVLSQLRRYVTIIAAMVRLSFMSPLCPCSTSFLNSYLPSPHRVALTLLYVTVPQQSVSQL